MPGMSTKSREVIWGGQVRAAEMNAGSARQRAREATREADRAEAHAWSLRMEGFGDFLITKGWRRWSSPLGIYRFGLARVRRQCEWLTIVIPCRSRRSSAAGKWPARANKAPHRAELEFVELRSV
jgi:hypothetical protein